MSGFTEHTTHISDEDDILYSDECYSYADLPEEILYIIFSLLHPDDLVHCGQVCSKWRQLSLYPHFWNKIFSSRSRFGHQLNLLNLRSDHVQPSQVYVWDNPRDVYLAVRQGVRDVQTVNATLSNHLTYSIRSWLGFYPPKFMVIGSGSRNLVGGGDYEITRLSDMRFPNLHSTSLPTINSVTLRAAMGWNQMIKWRLELGLIKSYAMESHQRTSNALERLRESVLLDREDCQKEGAEIDWSKLKTITPVYDISSHFLAYIYVINGESTNTEDIQLLRWEFHAFLENFLQRPSVPVLVLLSWRKVPSKLTLYQVVQYFHLPALQNPWAVYDWDVKKKQGFMEGLTWLCMQVMS